MEEFKLRLKIAFKKLGIFLGYVLGIGVMFTAFIFWKYLIDQGNGVIIFITKWFIILPFGLILGIGLLLPISEGIYWLFIEPFKKDKK